ncbi:MAG TPA: polyamine aminopropyltransferase [Alphaproteobacteria bacterium]|nr:polyamine aminopropyltransferase [Alphaproteobacteria bacterium]
MTEEWFTETLHPAVAQRLRMERVVFRDRTEHQDLVIFENGSFGRVLALDGVVQTTTGDEFIYHEMLAHVPILAHGRAERVLIIGGGDGGMLRRCLMHPGVRKVTMVEIDRSVVDLCREHLPAISDGAFVDPRTDLVIADGCRFVKETDERYDVVIVDSTDPIGPGAVLFTPEFYADCKRCMTAGGVFVNQNGVPSLDTGEQRRTYAKLKGLFADVWAYGAPVPTYYGGLMTFGWATDDMALRRTPVDELQRRFAASGLETRWYTPELHAAGFAVPRPVLELLE